MGTAISFILIFCIIVVSHELGHFIVAKKNGIHVVEFFVGMGPTLIHFTKGDTKYSLKLLPIGGACVFEGDDGLAESKGEASEGAFPNASVGARISTIFAGPFFNFVIAYIIGLLLVANMGSDLPIVQEVAQGGQAEAAGIRAGDEIQEVNGENIHIYRQISLISAINKGEPLTITYKRDGVENSVVVTPAYNEEQGRYFIGLNGSGEYIECGILQTFQYAFYEVEFGFSSTIKSLKMLVQGKVTKDDVAGPVGMVKVVGDTYEVAKNYGVSIVIFSMLNIAMILSVNLGIMNLLPIPALDGGRLVFLLIELIRGKPVSAEKEGMVHLGGMIALMVLMVIVLFNDISKFFS